MSASEDHTVCVWYYKKTKAMSKVYNIISFNNTVVLAIILQIESEELLMEDSDPTFPDIPIRIINTV